MKIRLKLTLLFTALFAALLLVFALAIYYSNALVETFNAFDPRPVMADARVWLDK